MAGVTRNADGSSWHMDVRAPKISCPAHFDKDRMKISLQGRSSLSQQPAECNLAGGEPSSQNGNTFEAAWTSGDVDPLHSPDISQRKKWRIAIVLANASLCVTCTSSIYTTTYKNMEAELHNTRIVSVLGLSTFVLGLAFGPILLSPLSEFYGRRPIYLVSWTMYLIFLIPQAVAKNVSTILVCRFLDGFSGSAFLTVSGGTVRDLFSGKDLQTPMALYSVSQFMGPGLGPLVGGFINYHADWRWTCYTLLIWSIFVALVTLIYIPETYQANDVLAQQIPSYSKRRHVDAEMKQEINIGQRAESSIIHVIGLSLLRPLQLLLFEPMCLCLCIFSAVLLGILYLFFGAIPLVLGMIYQFKLYQTGLAFLGIMVGMLIGAATDPLWQRVRSRLARRYAVKNGMNAASEPEFWLSPAIFGAFLVPIGIFLFGWSSNPRIHWLVPIIGTAVFGFGNVLVFGGIFTFLVDTYPRYAASALAANSFMRCVFAAAFPLFGDQIYEKLGCHWASSLLAFLTVVMLPFPYIFVKYGKRIRNRSPLSIS